MPKQVQLDGPTFPQRVIRLVKQIPDGQVSTYGTIATLANSPRSARLVGGVMHLKSVQDEDVPWWRVINRNGFISIKCLDHPKSLQKALLEQEGVVVSDDFMVDLSKYGWFGESEIPVDRR